MKFKVQQVGDYQSNGIPVEFHVFDTVWVPGHKAPWGSSWVEGSLQFVGQYIDSPNSYFPKSITSVEVSKFQEIPDETS